MSNEVPLVSVCMITYNHEKYIGAAIEGVLMQKTDFPVELVIGEDCSTDATRKICQEYEREYPERVRVLKRYSNLGIVANFVETISGVKSEFIALCEGDDYWTNPLKLAEQVAFLQRCEHYSGVCSNVRVLDEQSQTLTNQTLYDKFDEIVDFDFDLVLHETIVHTPTLLFRNNLIDLSLLRAEHIFADLSTALLLLDKGPIQFWNRADAVYRRHGGGITHSTEYNKFYEQIIEFLDDLNRYTEFRRSDSIKDRQRLLRILMDVGGSSRNPFTKLLGVYHYFRHDRTKLTVKEIKNVAGLAFPRAVAKFRGAG